MSEVFYYSSGDQNYYRVAAPDAEEHVCEWAENPVVSKYIIYFFANVDTEI